MSRSRHTRYRKVKGTSAITVEEIGPEDKGEDGTALGRSELEPSDDVGATYAEWTELAAWPSKEWTSSEPRKCIYTDASVP